MVGVNAKAMIEEEIKEQQRQEYIEHCRKDFEEACRVVALHFELNKQQDKEELK